MHGARIPHESASRPQRHSPWRLGRPLLPDWAEPYARLARWDRPIGTWLLLFPGWWGIALAGPKWPNLGLMALFALGALGDARRRLHPQRHRRPPLSTARSPAPACGRSRAAGSRCRRQSLFMAGQLAIGAAVLLSLNRASHMLGLAVIGLIATYPFMKRITYWPQLFLGLNFNWGALDRLGRGDRQPRLAAGAALSRRHLLDARLRHDLRPPGQGGRRPHRGQILGPGARRLDPPVPVRCSMPPRWRYGARRRSWRGSTSCSGTGWWSPRRS